MVACKGKYKATKYICYPLHDGHDNPGAKKQL
jgi:hypothetical protein